MKTSISFILSLCLLAWASVSHADFVVIQEMEAQGQKTPMHLKIAGDQVRVDMGNEVSMIINTTNNDMVTLMHPQNSYMKISGAQSKALMDQMKQLQEMMGEAPAEASDFTLEATGNREQIGSFDAEEYVWSDGDVQGTFWFAKDVPFQEQIVNSLKALQDSALGGDASAFGPAIEDLPGLPVKTVIQDPAAGVITTTLVSVEETDLPTSEFEVPEGYQAMQMPGMDFQLP